MKRYTNAIVLAIAAIFISMAATPRTAAAQCQICNSGLQRTGEDAGVNQKTVTPDLSKTKTGAYCESVGPNDYDPGYVNCQISSDGQSCILRTRCFPYPVDLSTSFDGRVRPPEDVNAGGTGPKVASTHEERTDCQGRVVSRSYTVSEQKVLKRQLSTIVI